MSPSLPRRRLGGAVRADDRVERRPSSGALSRAEAELAEPTLRTELARPRLPRCARIRQDFRGVAAMSDNIKNSNNRLEGEAATAGAAAAAALKGFFSAMLTRASGFGGALSKAARAGRFRRKRPRGVLELRRACKLKQPLSRAPREPRCSQPASTSGATALPLS